MNASSRGSNADSSADQPHVIRIRGPWQRTVVCDGPQISDDASVPQSATVKMPGSWLEDLGEDFRGTVRYQRMFNRPTGLTEATNLQLVFQQVVGDAEVYLNDQPLGTIRWPECTSSFDVTNVLEARNQIRVEIRALTPDRVEAGLALPPGGMVGEVQLQIR